jgi:hypothetical protein
MNQFLIILAGQSNMAGRGGVSSTDSNNKTTFHPTTPSEILLSTQDPTTNIIRLSSTLTWEPAIEPLHFDIDTKKNCGIGPGLQFGRILNQYYHYSQIRLIPCAIGGTKIAEWNRDGNFYQQMLLRYKIAMSSSIHYHYHHHEILIWYQGESDALEKTTVDEYKNNLELFIHHILQDFNPNIIIIGVLISGISSKLPYIQEIREIQYEIFSKYHVIIVDANNQAWNEIVHLRHDDLHLTSEAAINLGEKIANELIQYLLLYKKVII